MYRWGTSSRSRRPHRHKVLIAKEPEALLDVGRAEAVQQRWGRERRIVSIGRRALAHMARKATDVVRPVAALTLAAEEVKCGWKLSDAQEEAVSLENPMG